MGSETKKQIIILAVTLVLITLVLLFFLFFNKKDDENPTDRHKKKIEITMENCCKYADEWYAACDTTPKLWSDEVCEEQNEILRMCDEEIPPEDIRCGSG